MSSNIHTMLLRAVQDVTREHDDRSLRAKGWTIGNTGNDSITIAPRAMNRLGSRLFFDFVTVHINALVANDMYDDNSPTGASPTIRYNWSSTTEVPLSDFYRQLLFYVKENGLGIFQEEIKNHNLRKYKPMEPKFDTTMIIDQLIVVAFLRFCKYLDEQDHKAMKSESYEAHQEKVCLAKTSNVVNAALSAKPKRKASANSQLWSSYYLVEGASGSKIKRLNQPNCVIEVSEGTPRDGKPVVKILLRERIEGRMKPRSKLEVFSRLELARMAYHYISENANPNETNGIDALRHIEGASESITSKKEEFLTDENGDTICLNDIDLAVALYEYARVKFPAKQKVINVA